MDRVIGCQALKCLGPQLGRCHILGPGLLLSAHLSQPQPWAVTLCTASVSRSGDEAFVIQPVYRWDSGSSGIFTQPVLGAQEGDYLVLLTTLLFATFCFGHSNFPSLALPATDPSSVRSFSHTLRRGLGAQWQECTVTL